MTRFQLQVEDGAFHVAGALDEHADFQPVLASQADPLKISFGGVTSLSSEGAKILTALAKDLGTRNVELHDVPAFLVAMINVVPALLGKRAKSVQSLYALYHCPKCRQTSEMLVRRQEVRMSSRGTEAPARRCEACDGPMKLQGEEEDVFLFLTYSA